MQDAQNRQLNSTAFSSWLRYCSDVAQRKPTKLCTMFGYIDCIYIFGGCCSVTEFCQVQNSVCVLQVLRSPIGSVTARQSSSGREPNCGYILLWLIDAKEVTSRCSSRQSLGCFEDTKPRTTKANNTRTNWQRNITKTKPKLTVNCEHCWSVHITVHCCSIQRSTEQFWQSAILSINHSFNSGNKAHKTLKEKNSYLLTILTSLLRCCLL